MKNKFKKLFIIFIALFGFCNFAFAYPVAENNVNSAVTASVGFNTSGYACAQSFVAGSSTISALSFVYQKFGNNPATTTLITLETDNANKPSGNVLASTTFIANTPANKYYNLNIDFPYNSLSAGTTYWFTFRNLSGAVNATDYISMAYNNNVDLYTSGKFIKTGNNMAWGTASDYDLNFRIYDTTNTNYVFPPSNISTSTLSNLCTLYSTSTSQTASASSTFIQTAVCVATSTPAIISTNNSMGTTTSLVQYHDWLFVNAIYLFMFAILLCIFIFGNPLTNNKTKK